MISNKLDADLILLCGGLGTRFQSVSSKTPKVLTKFYNKNYLDLVIEKCINFKIKSLILATGHLHEEIEKYLRNKLFGLKIILSKENEPLGTWGAILNAKQFIRESKFFVMNGDTFNDLDLISGLKFFSKKRCTVLTFGSEVKLKDDNDYGNIQINEKNQVLDFLEKPKIKNNFCKFRNSGIYLFNSEILNKLSGFKKSSLEKDILPILIKEKLVMIYNESVNFYDFGTLERFEKFMNFEINKWL